MIKVFAGFLLVLLVFGCIELTEKQPEQPPAPPAPPAPPDQNVPDVNAPTDFNNGLIELPPGIEPGDECLLQSNTTKVDSCIFNRAIANLDRDACLSLTILDPDNCFLEIAKISKERSDCLSIQKQGVENGCLNEIGTELKDISFCDRIEGNDELKNNCFYTIYPYLEATHCKKIFDTDKREDCLALEAELKSDHSFCALISGSIRKGIYFRDQCLDRFYDSFVTPDACKLYFVSERTQECFLSVGTRNNNIDSCLLHTDQQLASDCAKTVSIATSNQPSCARIPKEAAKQECFVHFAINDPKIGYCDAVKDAQIRKECYNAVGVSSLDAEVCRTIYEQLSAEQTNCYLEVAKKTNDETVCDRIYATKFDQKDDCFGTIAKAKLDFPVCEKIHFGENYVSCFSSIAISVNNFGVCDNMKQDFFIGLGFNPKFGCYKEFAVAKKDRVACEVITSKTMRDECLGAIG